MAEQPLFPDAPAELVRTPPSLSDELDNPVRAVVTCVELGALDISEAVDAVTRLRRLRPLSDQQRFNVLLAAGRAAVAVEATRPRTALTHRLIIAACAHAELDRVKRVAAAANGEPSAEARLGTWTGWAAACLLRVAEARLFHPDLYQAMSSFRTAEFAARQAASMPAIGEAGAAPMRMAALHGIATVAERAGLVADAEHARIELADLTGRHGVTLMPSITAQFAEIWRVHDELAQQEWPDTAVRPSAAGEYEATEYSALLGAAARTADQRSTDATLQDAVRRVPDAQIQLVRRFLVALSDIHPPRGLAVSSLHRQTVESALGADRPLAVAAARYTYGDAVLKTTNGPVREEARRLTLREAAGALQATRVVFETHGDSMSAARAAGFSSRALRFTGDLDEAEEAAQDAVGRWKAVPTSRVQRMNLTAALGELAAVRREQGRIEEALDAYHEAYDVALQVGNLDHALLSAQHIYNLSRQLGRSDEAARAAVDVLDLVEAVSTPVDLVRAAVFVAETALQHWQLALVDDALARADRLIVAETRRRDSLDREWLALISMARRFEAAALLARTAPERLDDTSALLDELSGQARMAAEEAGDQQQHALALLLSARIDVERQRPLDAMRWLDAPPPDDLPLHVRPYFTATRADAQRLVDPAAALALLDEAAQQYREVGEFHGAARTLITLGRTCAALGRADAALDAFRRAGDLVDELCADLIADDNRIAVRGLFDDLYRDAVLGLAALGETADETWTRVQRAKSQTFVELIRLGKLAVSSAELDPRTADLLTEEAALLQQLRVGRTVPARLSIPTFQPETRPTALPLTQLRAAAAARRQLLHVWDQLAATLPEYVSLRSPHTPNWEAVRDALTAEVSE